MASKELKALMDRIYQNARKYTNKKGVKMIDLGVKTPSSSRTLKYEMGKRSHQAKIARQEAIVKNSRLPAAQRNDGPLFNFSKTKK